MANLIKQIKGVDNVTYDLQDKVSTFGNTNLFRATALRDITKFLGNSSTDWTAYLRWYNSSAAIHTFSAYDVDTWQDTVLLNSAANLGICFCRKATDIHLDSSSYYTISCWAKSTQTAKPLCIGLSYYNNSNSWVWRGGSNGKAWGAANTWQYFTHTFKPDADTQYIMYCFTVVGVANATDTFTIRECKLEKGSKPSKWQPAPEDLALYTASNETISFFQ